MKLRKILAVITITLLAVVMTSMLNVSNAATGSKYLGIKMLRKSGYGYKALEKNVWQTGPGSIFSK